jgi:flagellar biosynthesis protein FliQ
MLDNYAMFAPDLFSILGSLLGFFVAKIVNESYSNNTKYPFYYWPDKSTVPAIIYSIIIGLLVSWVNVDLFINEENWSFYARRDGVMSFVISGLFTTMLILKYAYSNTVMVTERNKAEISQLKSEISNLKPKHPGNG